MITIFFGAGAESCYGLCEGKKFIEPILMGEYNHARSEMIHSGAYNLLHSNSKYIYLQTINTFNNEAREIFDKDLICLCNRKYECNDLSTSEEKELSDCCSQWYSLIKSDYKRTSKKEKERDFFLNHAVFFDALDSKFNDLRNFPLCSKGNRVINTYATIFILIISHLFKIPNDFKWKYENIFSLIENKENIKIDYDIDSYYFRLKKYKNNINVVTTNYTLITDEVIDKDVCHLHGHINLFEDYKGLRVFDIRDENDKKEAIKHESTLFPFLMIPSGVKPIICKQQIESFHNFINYLTESKCLIVIGFKFNSEDNHINSIIIEWLLSSEGNQLIYFNYDSSMDWSIIKWSDSLSKKDINISDIDDQYLGSEKIINIKINPSFVRSEQIYSCFEKIVKNKIN